MSAWWAQPTVLPFEEGRVNAIPAILISLGASGTATLYNAAGTIQAQNVWGVLLTPNPESELGAVTSQQEPPKWVPPC